MELETAYKIKLVNHNLKMLGQEFKQFPKLLHQDKILIKVNYSILKQNTETNFKNKVNTVVKTMKRFIKIVLTINTIRTIKTNKTTQ